jgi:malonyl-CoA decarboxylase
MAETRTAPGLLDRTLQGLRGAWRGIASWGDSAPGDPDLEDRADRLKLVGRIHACLEARGGEVSARARAVELGRTYLALSKKGRRRFLLRLATEFDTDRTAVDAALAQLATASDDGTRGAAEEALREALEPPRVKLLRQFNALPEGTKFLVDLRADVMRSVAEEPALTGLDADLKRLLASWFDIGFLELRRITWSSPAALLEKLGRYEAVHVVRGWQDLKNRLDSDRRFFAFFHPSMPDEPLIFVEVALLKGLAADVGKLLDASAPADDPAVADTAIFYSITNAQRGLAGISFGGFLIKRVVDQLSAEFPKLKTFATLSPIPGLRAWITQRLERETPDFALASGERKALGKILGPVQGSPANGPGHDVAMVKHALATAGWYQNAGLRAALEKPLSRLTAEYLLTAKRRDGRALDPVAQFHLSNGARVERLNPLADTSKRGLEQSYGMMVNYAYRLAEIEENLEAYTGEGKIAAASAVAGLV